MMTKEVFNEKVLETVKFVARLKLSGDPNEGNLTKLDFICDLMGAVLSVEVYYPISVEKCADYFMQHADIQDAKKLADMLRELYIMSRTIQKVKYITTVL